MEHDRDETMQFDETGLISTQAARQVGGFGLSTPRQKPVETVTEILQNIINKDSIPKEDLRRTWNNKKSEREKMLKQWNKAKKSLSYWVSKTKLLEHKLSRNAEELERMRGRMLADCLSED